LARGYWHAQRSFLIPGIGQLFVPLCTCAGAAFVSLGFWNLTYAAAAANVGALLLLFILGKPLFAEKEKLTTVDVKSMLAKFGTSFISVSIGLALMPAMVVIARRFAAFLAPGSVTAISLAASLGSIPAQFAAASVGTVLLSQASVLKAAGRLADRTKVIERGLCNTAFVAIPCAIAMLVWCKGIVGIVFQRGAFDKTAVDLTASALRCYSVAIPVQTAVQVLTFALFAIAGSRRVAFATVGTLAINIVLSAFLLRWGVAGVAGAFSLATFLNFIALLWLLKRSIPEFPLRHFLGRNLRMAITSVASAAAALVASNQVEVSSATLALSIALSVFGTSYLLLNLLLGAPEMHEIIGVLRLRVTTSGRVQVVEAAD